MRTAIRPVSWIIALVLVALLKHSSGFLGVLDDMTLVGSDDYVRLAQVRDWMAGAAWFDVTQDRLGPAGIAMHWSRVIDLPIAGLVRLFSVVTTLDMAEKLAVIVWPMTTLVVFAGIVVAAARRLDSAANPFVVVLLIAVHGMTANQFAPGRIDHHNVQIIAVALVFLGALDRDGRRGGILAGLACALSMVVGMEALGPIAVFGLIFAGGWIFGIDPGGTRFGAFGLGFAAGTLSGYAISIEPARYLSTACDALSPSYAVPIVIAGAGAYGLARMSDRMGVRGRIGACTGLLIASVGALHTIEPACMAGPYAAISDEAASRWLSRIVEAQGLPVYLGQLPIMGGVYILCAGIGAAAGMSLYGGSNVQDRWRMAVVVVPIIVLFGLSFLQMRQGQFIGIFTIPAIAACYPALRRRMAARSPLSLSVSAKGAIAIAVGTLTFHALSTPLQHSRPTQAATRAPIPSSSPATCMARASYRQLAALPQGRVLNPHLLGGRLLTSTHHHILVGPYHRSSEAVLDGIDLIGGDIERIQTIIRERRAHYVALCLNDRAMGYAAEEGLLPRLSAGAIPPWLDEIHVSGDLHVYRTTIPLAPTAAR